MPHAIQLLIERPCTGAAETRFGGDLCVPVRRIGSTLLSLFILTATTFAGPQPLARLYQKARDAEKRGDLFEARQHYKKLQFAGHRRAGS